jgi:hypothetical protein
LCYFKTLDLNFERANKGIAKVVYLCMNEGLYVPKLVHHAKLASQCMHLVYQTLTHLNPCENCQSAKPCENSHKSPMQTTPPQKRLKLFTHHQSQHVKKILESKSLDCLKMKCFPPTPTKRDVQLVLQWPFQNLIYIWQRTKKNPSLSQVWKEMK